MPTDGPVPDLSPQLFSMLLRSAGWLLLAAFAVAGVTWLIGRRHEQARSSRLATVLGAAGQGRSEPPQRRFVRITFGLLWIAAGLLQAQPNMPGGFVPRVIAPEIASGPSWLADLIQPLTTVWTKHPVVADAVTVWIQVGLGLLILVGGSGILARLVLWLSAAWSVCVWVVGEFLGGMLEPGASWLVGAPGAVLVYLLAAGLLLVPWSWWESGRSTWLVRRGVGAWFLAGAALQAIPWEGSWSADGLSEPFSNGAQTAQPSLLRRPIEAMATLTSAQPATLNAVLIALLVVVGLGLWLSRSSVFVVAGLVLCAATWWLGQDFGVLGGTATDPNTALPLGLLLAAALPHWTSAPQQQPLPEGAHEARSRPGRSLREPWIAGVTALGLGAAVAAPLLVTGLLLAPADAAAVAADSGGGVVVLRPRPAPQFSLTDQNGRSVSSVALRGKLTLVTFLDPVCSDECPVIANQLALADAALGSLSERVEIVAIDSNPVFHKVSDVAAFTASHGLSDLPNWHFLAGSESDLRDLLTSYGVAVAVPTVGMIEHSEGIHFISADGNQVAYLGDGADTDLTASYVDQIRAAIEELLK